MLSTCKGPEKWRDRGERAREEPAKSPSTLFFISGVGGGGKLHPGQTEMLALCPGHMAAARGWVSAHSFPEVTPPGQTGLGSGGGSFYSACAVREAVYLTWPEPECWPCKLPEL